MLGRSLSLLHAPAARPLVAVPVLCAYPAYVARRLLRSGAAAAGASATSKGGANKAAGRVSLSCAAAYVFFHIFIGTNAEAVNDMAIGHRVRRELGKGNAGLALTNNLSVLLSQLLALASEFGVSRRDERVRIMIE